VIIALVISFVPELRRLMEGFMVKYFLYHCQESTQANGFIHEERSTGVGSDRMVEMVILI